MSRLARAAAAVLALAALLAGCGSSSSAPKSVNATIAVAGGKPQGGVQGLTVRKGGRVHLVVRSDTADEVHIHGYDLHEDVAEGASTTFDFPATIDGRFEIELENAHEQLARLRVEP